jgi:hypothetical protein
VTPRVWLLSCVHMHCNRLLGTDRTLEFEVLYTLGRTLEVLEHCPLPGVKLD